MTRSRSLLLIGTLAAAAAVAVLLMADSERPAEVPAVDATAQEIDPPDRVSEEWMDVSPAADATPGSSPGRVAVPVQDDAAASTGSASVTALSGTVVVEELDGRFTRPKSGRVYLMVRRDGDTAPAECTIDDGAWRFELARGDDGVYRTADGDRRFDPGHAEYGLLVSGVELGDEREGVSPAFDKEMLYPFGTSGIELVLRRVPPLVLDVRDAATGAHVTGVRVVAILDHEHMDQLHPGDARCDTVVDRADSPITRVSAASDVARGLRACLVGSSGYAWERVEIDFSVGGERRVELGQGGALTVTVRGPQKEATQLRLYAGGGDAFYSSEALDGATTYAFESVRPGDYSVRAELGKWYRSPAVEGRAEATVVAGVTESVEIQLDSTPEVARARVSGRLVLPVEWEIPRFYASFNLQGPSLDETSGRITLYRHEFERVGGSKDTFSFDLGEVQVGRYEMTLEALQFGIAFDVGPEGRSDVLMDVPPPVEISVSIVDAQSGTTASTDRLLWNAVRPEGNQGGGLQSVERDEDESLFRFRTPRGEIELSSWSDEYTYANKIISAVAGGTYELEVERASAALLRLMDGDSLVPWPDDDYGGGEAVAHDGALASRSRRDGALWLTVTEPGRYRFEVPRINGFEDHEPFELDLVRGETVEHTVSIQRKR